MDTFDRLFLFVQKVRRMRELQTTGTLSTGWVTTCSLDEAERMVDEMVASILGCELAPIPAHVVAQVLSPSFMVEVDSEAGLMPRPALWRDPVPELPELPGPEQTELPAPDAPYLPSSMEWGDYFPLPPATDLPELPELPPPPAEGTR